VVLLVDVTTFKVTVMSADPKPEGAESDDSMIFPYEDSVIVWIKPNLPVLSSGKSKAR